MLPPMLGYIIGNAMSSIYISKIGKYKLWTVSGCSFGCIGFLMLILRFRGYTKTYEIIYLMPSGVAMGFVMATMFTHVAVCILKQEVAIASGCFYLFTNQGLLLGINLSNALLHSCFFAASNQLLEGIEGKEKVRPKLHMERRSNDFVTPAICAPG